MSRFLCWLRSFCIETTMPVGMCVMRIAESVLLTFCPPAPLDRKVSMRTSAGVMSTSISSSSSGAVLEDGVKAVCGGLTGHGPLVRPGAAGRFGAGRAGILAGDGLVSGYVHHRERTSSAEPRVFPPERG